MINIFLLFFFILFTTIYGALLGIDFGTERIKVAGVASGKSFQIVLDEASKRAHPNLVVFDNDVRQYGTSASSLVSRRPLKSFQSYQYLLGITYNNDIINEYKSEYLFNELLKDNKTNLIKFKSPYFKEITSNKNAEDKIITATSYSVEEITAMKLKHIKKMAEKELSVEVNDVVLTVPDYWTIKQRQALLDSAKISGLNVLGLINENTAAALQYAIRGSLNETEIIMLYNMGAKSTKVSVVKFEKQFVKKTKGKNQTMNLFHVISKAWNTNLGTINFDNIIINYIINEAKPVLTSKIKDLNYNELTQDPRFTARIKIAAQRAKKILSANNEAPISIEGIYKDIDFKTQITREYLETEGNKLNIFNDATIIMDNALKNGKLNKNNITAIVLLGGGTRIPRIRSILNDYLGKPFRENLNSDESPAFGACFRAANLSSTFKVRQVPMDDITPYSMGVRLSNLNDNDNEWKKRGSLFKKNNILFRRRAVTLHHDKNLKVDLFYEKENELPKYIDNYVGYYEITNIEKSVKKYLIDEDGKYNVSDTPKISLSFLLNGDSIVDLVAATATFTEYVTKEVPVKKESDKKSDDKDDDTKKDDNKEDDSDGEKSDNSDKNDENSETTTDENEKTDETKEDSKTEDDKTENDKTENKKDEKIETEKVIKKRTHRVELKINKVFEFERTEDDFTTSKKILLELDDRDRSVLDTAHARNDLEAFIFESRNRINDDKLIEQVSTEEQRENLLSELNAAEDWIWEIEQETTAIYKKKLREIKETCKDIFSRADEIPNRKEAVDIAGKVLSESYVYHEMLVTNYTWLSKNETDKLYDLIKSTEVWLNEMIDKQSEKSLLEDPAFHSNDVYKKIDPIIGYGKKLLRKRAPKDWFKKKDNETKNGNDTEINVEEIDTDGNDTDSDVDQDKSDKEDDGEENNEDNNDDENEKGDL